MPHELSIEALNTQLARHPRNMRRIYKLADVRQMAASQARRAEAGQPPCVQPLIVTPGAGVTHYSSKEHPKLTVIAGHLRLEGNRYLGKRAPRLNCIVRFYKTEAEMLADMSAENGLRADPGPVSWALHFQTQLAAGRPMRELITESGKSFNRINDLLRLLELGEETQMLIDEGHLPPSAADQLVRIGDSRLQARTARKFIKQHTQTSQMKLVVDHVVNPHTRSAYAGTKKVPQRIQAEELRKLKDTPAQPALEGQPLALAGTDLDDVRRAAALTCKACPISDEHRQPEAAWHMARAAAGEVCTDCNLRLVKGACAGCPLPQMLSRIVRQVQGRRPAKSTASALAANRA